MYTHNPHPTKLQNIVFILNFLMFPPSQNLPLFFLKHILVLPVIELQTVGTLVFNRFYQFLWFVLVAHPAVFCFILLMGIEYIIISNPFSCCCWISINLKQLAFSTVFSYCELSCYEHSYTSHLCMYVYVYLFLLLLRYLEMVLLRGKHMFMKNFQLIPQIITILCSH